MYQCASRNSLPVYIPEYMPVGKYRIEISCFKSTSPTCGAILSDKSDDFIWVVASSTAPKPSVKVLYPNGGETIAYGNNPVIKWKNTGLGIYDTVRLELKNETDGGYILNQATQDESMVLDLADILKASTRYLCVCCLQQKIHCSQVFLI